MDSKKFLNSWKEIADYLGRTVRTVQRWEKLGLPVRRPVAHRRSAVIAIPSEIDQWLARRSTHQVTCPFGFVCYWADRVRAGTLFITADPDNHG